MAKKNRGSEEVEEVTGFRISKTKVGKSKLVTVTFQLTEIQDAHLTAVANGEDTTRAEFCKQAVNYCLSEMGKPFPDAGEAVDETVTDMLDIKRAKREARRAARGA